MIRNSRYGVDTATSCTGAVWLDTGVSRFRDRLGAVRSAMTSRLQAADVLLTGLSAQQDLLAAILATAHQTCAVVTGGQSAR
jgi:hypothetical protein